MKKTGQPAAKANGKPVAPAPAPEPPPDMDPLTGEVPFGVS
jgi:hypothetical protein